MKKIVLISCVSKNLPYKEKVKNLYISPLFKNKLDYAQKFKPDKIYVLSAKYGLLNLETEIEPYDLTLNNMSLNEVKVWSERVIKQISTQADLNQDNFILLAGKKYRNYLIPHISFFQIPLEGMTIGNSAFDNA